MVHVVHRTSNERGEDRRFFSNTVSAGERTPQHSTSLVRLISGVRQQDTVKIFHLRLPHK